MIRNNDKIINIVLAGVEKIVLNTTDRPDQSSEQPQRQTQFMLTFQRERFLSCLTVDAFSRG